MYHTAGKVCEGVISSKPASIMSKNPLAKLIAKHTSVQLKYISPQGHNISYNSDKTHCTVSIYYTIIHQYTHNSVVVPYTYIKYKPLTEEQYKSDRLMNGNRFGPIAFSLIDNVFPITALYYQLVKVLLV